MTNEPLPPDIVRAIDSRTEALIEEFRGYADRLYSRKEQEQRESPGSDDAFEPGEVFESWCLQKLASLQFLTIQLMDRVAELERR